MADQLPRNPSRSEEQYIPLTNKWYFTKEEIENCSPSRKYGISHDQEAYLRKLYCSFIQELGVELKVPQVTIATAIILSHRFYMRQSHAKSHWQTVAAVSMFLACKAEETPRLLSDFVIVSYKLMYKWDPSAPQRIKERDVYNQQKELLLLGERLLLATVSFDFNIEQPYKPLIGVLKKLQIPHNELVKVAWNFVNDTLRTTLCLQYKPAYIAAGSVSLAAKFLKVKLPRLNGNPWWLLFDVSPRRLEEVIQAMFTLLGKNQKQTVPSPVTPSTGRMMTKSKPKNDQALADSAKSCISSLNVVTAQNSSDTITVDDERRATISVPECTQEKSANNDHDGDPSDHGSSNRTVKDEDGDPTEKDHGLNPSCKTISKKIDVDRIREMIKKRKSSELEKKQIKDMKDEIVDNETWIEKELENGNERDLNPSCEIASKKIDVDVDRIREMIKRRKSGGFVGKRVQGTEVEIDSEIWIERELENGIKAIRASPKKRRIV